MPLTWPSLGDWLASLNTPAGVGRGEYWQGIASYHGRLSHGLGQLLTALRRLPPDAPVLCAIAISGYVDTPPLHGWPLLGGIAEALWKPISPEALQLVANDVIAWFEEQIAFQNRSLLGYSDDGYAFYSFQVPRELAGPAAWYEWLQNVLQAAVDQYTRIHPSLYAVAQATVRDVNVTWHLFAWAPYLATHPVSQSPVPEIPQPPEDAVPIAAIGIGGALVLVALIGRR